MPVETRQRTVKDNNIINVSEKSSNVQKDMNISREQSTQSKNATKWWHFNLPDGDRSAVLLLTFLYLLQGIPLGLTGSIPYILTSRHVSYSQQATFSFAFWPFSLKLLWAPIVDSIYSRRFGRRKSWLVPIQYALGLSMLWLSWHVTDWLGDDKSSTSNTPPTGNASGSKGEAREEIQHSVALSSLTLAFFWLNFLAATQDIIVDGWALSILSRPNIGWASTCNTVGQTLGYVIAFMLFLSLESKDFCNAWLRSEPKPYGLVTFSEFLLFWAIVFVISNTLVCILKKENPTSPLSKVEDLSSPLLVKEHECKHSPFQKEIIEVNDQDDSTDDKEDSVEDLSERLTLMDSYRMLWKIMWLKPVLSFILTLFLVKFGFSAADNLTVLKLIERGVAKERLAFLGLFSMPIQILLPLMLNRYVTGPRPFTTYMRAALPRTLFSFFCILIVYYTPYFQHADKSFPTSYYVLLVVITILQQIFVYTMFVCQMAFQARISDPAVGGTYMTLLNTAANLSGNIPGTLVMYFVDPLSKKICSSGSQKGQSCLTQVDYATCVNNGGECSVHVEGFYILTIFCTICGFVSILSRTTSVRRLENLSLRAWFVVPRSNK